MPATDTTTAPPTSEDLRVFAQILKGCRDDAGLIDEQRLEQLTDQAGITPGRMHVLLAKWKGCVRMGWGWRLAAGDTTKARAKAALLSLRRPGSTTEVAAMTRRDLVDVASSVPFLSVYPTRRPAAAGSSRRRATLLR